MTITFLGWIILPLSLALIISKPEWVYAMAIFFLPFSATAVVNLGSGDSGSGIQVWFYLAILLLLRWAFVSLFEFEIIINKELRRPLAYLMLFVIVCAISLLMPFWINGRLQIMSPFLMDFTTTPLVFSSKNITGFIYILVGFSFTIFIANKNTTSKEFRRSSSLYLLSCVFLAGWGLLQLCLHAMHLPYPAMIFNNSASPAAAGYKETIGAVDIARLTSAAVEPGMLVQTLLVGIAFTLPALLGNGYIWSRYKDRMAAFLLISICLAATSSTGYIGLVLLFILICWELHRSKQLRASFVVLSIGGMFAAVGAYYAIGIFHDIINSALLNKSSSYSALERGKTIYYALQYFLDYPILGVGWASVTSHDLVAKLLSNTGILGFTTFCTFIGILLIKLSSRLRTGIIDKTHFDQASVILFIACVEMLALAVLSEFPDVFGHFWFILGMGIAATLRSLNKEPIFGRGTT
ncbi:MAG: hypothetical protein WA634_11290 [Silvibacterium sp.]